MSVKPLRIVIPSHKRHDRVFAKYLVTDPVICVAESQKDLYKRFNPDCEIVTHPDDVIGLIPKRNWMAKHFGNIFMLDDDVHTCKYLAADYGDCSVIKDREKVTRIIHELYDLAEVLDVHVFGFTNRTTPMMYEENAWLSFSKMITGCSYGVRYKKGVTWWNEDLKLKEDFWISCFAKFKERRILTDLRYSFSQKDTFVNPGGLSAFRNVEEERRSILLIRKHFGECIQMKGGACNNGKGSTKQMVEYNISVKFPF